MALNNFGSSAGNRSLATFGIFFAVTLGLVLLLAGTLLAQPWTGGLNAESNAAQTPPPLPVTQEPSPFGVTLKPSLAVEEGPSLGSNSSDGIRFHWIHFPKTGSSFGNVVLFAQCPRIPDKDYVISCATAKTCHTKKFTEPYGTHKRPLPKGYENRFFQDYKRWNAHRVCNFGAFPQGMYGHNPLERNQPTVTKVAMFRSPLRRVLSAYHAGLHAYNLETRSSRLYCSVRTPRQFVLFKGIANCQTKMLTGCGCATVCNGAGIQHKDSPARAKVLKNALHVVDHVLGFVGVLEEWELTIKLFHAIFGGEVRAADLKNDHKTPSGRSLKEACNFTASAWTPDSETLEDLDKALYLRVLERFFGEAVEHGLVGAEEAARRKACLGAAAVYGDEGDSSSSDSTWDPPAGKQCGEGTKACCSN